MAFPLFASRRAQTAGGPSEAAIAAEPGDPGGSPPPRASAGRRVHAYAREAAALVLLASALYAVLALASFRGAPRALLDHRLVHHRPHRGCPDPDRARDLLLHRMGEAGGARGDRARRSRLRVAAGAARRLVGRAGDRSAEGGGGAARRRAQDR